MMLIFVFITVVCPRRVPQPRREIR